MADAPQPIRKFLFDRSFSGADDIYPSAPDAPARPIHTADEMEAAKQEAYTAGYNAGQAVVKEDQLQRLNRMLERLCGSITGLLDHANERQKQQNSELCDIALAVARKLLPTYTSREGLQEIGAVITSTIQEMAREPRLVVRIHEAQFDAVSTKINEITAREAYAGKVVILADQEVAEGDCRIEWADGGIERDTQSIWNEIDRIAAKGRANFNVESPKTENNPTTNLAV